MLDLSQEDLEVRSGVAKRTIAEFERGGAIPFARTLDQLRAALEVAGVALIPENGGGAGVRRREAIPRFARKKINRFEGQATIVMSYRGLEYIVNLSTDILDDIYRIGDPTDEDREAALSKHLNRVLLRAAAAIDAGRAGDTRHIVLTYNDFPKVG
jgi:transcriptional regulator with XRE-family HTH domain